MNKKQAFESFGTIQTNLRRSWAAKSEDGKTVAITAWADQVHRTDSPNYYLDTFGLPHTQRNELWREDFYNRQRVSFMQHALANNDGLVRVVLLEAKDTHAFPREVVRNRVKPETGKWFRIVELNAETGEFRLEFSHTDD